jgi:hypothetical protein
MLSLRAVCVASTGSLFQPNLAKRLSDPCSSLPHILYPLPQSIQSPIILIPDRPHIPQICSGQLLRLFALRCTCSWIPPRRARLGTERVDQLQSARSIAARRMTGALHCAIGGGYELS